jgi:hypothetical protein
LLAFILLVVCVRLNYRLRLLSHFQLVQLHLAIVYICKIAKCSPIAPCDCVYLQNAQSSAVLIVQQKPFFTCSKIRVKNTFIFVKMVVSMAVKRELEDCKPTMALDCSLHACGQLLWLRYDELLRKLRYRLVVIGLHRKYRKQHTTQPTAIIVLVVIKIECVSSGCPQPLVQ